MSQLRQYLRNMFLENISKIRRTVDHRLNLYEIQRTVIDFSIAIPISTNFVKKI